MSRVRVAVIIVLGLVVFTLPFKRSWLLRADNQPTLQYTVLGAFDLASASVGSPSLYSVLRVTWQKLVGLDPSLLLWALELACIYRLTLLLFNWQIATVTTLLSNLPGLLLTPLGWTAYYSWLCLLSTVLTLMLWQISHRKGIERQVFLLASYFAIYIALVLSNSGLFVFFVFHIVCWILFVPKSPVKLLSLLVLIGLFIIGLLDANGSLWSIFSRALSTNDLVRLQLVVVGSGIGASIYLLQAWRRRSVLTTISANIFILMWIGACFADAVLFPAGRLVVIAIAAIPIGIGLVVTFSLLSRRSQVIVVCTGALVLTIPESLENFMPSLFTKYIPETAISINPSNQWDKAGLLAKLPQMNMLPAYFSIGDNYVLIIEGHQLPIVFQEID